MWPGCLLRAGPTGPADSGKWAVGEEGASDSFLARETEAGDAICWRRGLGGAGGLGAEMDFPVWDLRRLLPGALGTGPFPHTALLGSPGLAPSPACQASQSCQCTYPPAPPRPHFSPLFPPRQPPADLPRLLASAGPENQSSLSCFRLCLSEFFILQTTAEPLGTRCRAGGGHV